MSGLVLPRHLEAQKRAANAISNTSKHRIDSDDWATQKDVQIQLDQLQSYIDERREEEPDYNLPHPAGWKVMLLVITIPETTGGGVILVDDAREQRALASPQGIVLALGDQAYRDPDRFKAPWVELGDRTTIVKYDASMFQLGNGQRLGFVNDTQPVSVIDTGWGIPS